jgi:hypothetical protein
MVKSYGLLLSEWLKYKIKCTSWNNVKKIVKLTSQNNEHHWKISKIELWVREMKWSLIFEITANLNTQNQQKIKLSIKKS